MISNTMRFCTDTFGLSGDETGEGSIESTAAFVRRALLISKTALNCKNKIGVQRIVISGTQPAGSDRRFMFMIDNKYYKFNGSTLTEYTGAINVTNVLKDGNTAAQLTALSNITGFVGKSVYPIIALSASTEDYPTAKLQLTTTVANDVLSLTETSIIHELGADDSAVPIITNLPYEATLTGEGTVDIKIRLRNNGTWSDYMALNEAIDKDAQAAQFQVTYRVKKTDGTDSAYLNHVTLEHTLGKAFIANGVAHLRTKVVDYENDLSMCYVVIKHEPLQDSTLEALVNFMKKPSTRELLDIGTGTGSRQEFVLGVNGVADSKINTSTIVLYENGSLVEDFSYNSATSTITLNTVKNAIYTASYKYNHGVEDWRSMTLEEREPFNDETGMQTSRFSYVIPGDNTGLSVSNVLIRMSRQAGTVTNYSLGKATGGTQMFVLPHIPVMSSIKFTNKVDWDFDEDSNILTLVAAKNTALSVTYDWRGAPITLYSYVCGWAV